MEHSLDRIEGNNTRDNYISSTITSHEQVQHTRRLERSMNSRCGRGQLTAEDYRNHEQRARQVSEECEEPMLQHLEDADSTVDEGQRRVHEATGRKVGTRENDHYEACPYQISLAAILSFETERYRKGSIALQWL